MVTAEQLKLSSLHFTVHFIRSWDSRQQLLQIVFFFQKSNKWITTTLQAGFNALLRSAQPVFLMYLISYGSSKAREKENWINNVIKQRDTRNCKEKAGLFIFLTQRLTDFIIKETSPIWCDASCCEMIDGTKCKGVTF